MKRGKRTKGRRGGRRAATGAKFDVLGLRETLGRPHGGKAASRSMLAELIGASEGSVLNWEKGKPPTAKDAERLRELADQAARGSVSLPHRNRGGRRAKAGSNGASATRAAGLRRGTGRPPGRPPKAAPIAGVGALIYANQVSVESGRHDTRIRFSIQLPGEATARAVADVMLPRDVASSIRL